MTGEVLRVSGGFLSPRHPLSLGPAGCGSLRHGRAELVEDPEEVVRVHEVLLGRVGPKHARLLGLLGSNVDRRSTRGESKVVLAGILRAELDERRGDPWVWLQTASRLWQ